jgi:hypothetical protein
MSALNKKGNVVNFPVGRVANARFMPPDQSTEIEALALASESAHRAMKACDRQYRSLLIRLWRARGSKPCPLTLKWALELKEAQS